MSMEISGKTLRRIFLGIGGCILLYWILFQTDSVLHIFGQIAAVFSPFVVGAALAFVLNVPMRAIEKLLKKIPKLSARRALAIVLTLIAVALVLYGIFALLIPQMIDTVESIAGQLPDFFANVQKSIMNYLEENPEVMDWVTENTNFQNLDWGALVQEAVSFLTDGLGNVVEKAVAAVITLGTGIFNAILSFVFALYCLARKEILARQGRRLLYSVLPEKVCDEVIRISRMTNATFSRFISGQCIEALILGAMFAITMPIFGMPYAVLISVIISVTALVPIVGAFAGCIIGAFFILVVDPALAFWFIILFLALQQIEGNLIYPRVVGSSVGLPGMWVLLAVAIGGDLMGVGGMLLMIPVASVLYALAREFTDKRLDVRNVPYDKLQDHPINLERPKIERKPRKKPAETPEKTEETE
ncbi:MAG: AI-2E family transporter [Ruminococcaceae bacterium]|nr:AI-2E family transporter [Oscillospiraceae bacterium]